jgi:hypothetical protein
MSKPLMVRVRDRVTLPYKDVTVTGVAVQVMEQQDGADEPVLEADLNDPKVSITVFADTGCGLEEDALTRNVQQAAFYEPIQVSNPDGSPK